MYLIIIIGKIRLFVNDSLFQEKIKAAKKRPSKNGRFFAVLPLSLWPAPQEQQPKQIKQKGDDAKPEANRSPYPVSGSKQETGSRYQPCFRRE